MSKKEIALETRTQEKDMLSSPSALRNRDVVRNIFLQEMPSTGVVLEIASGTGQHAAHIATACPELTWQVSDLDEASRRSQNAWAAHLELTNILPSLSLDMTADQWWRDERLPSEINGLFCMNMIHIAPFEAAIGLFQGAGSLLKRGENLFLYGPFKREGETAPSNLQFDENLKSRDKSWGVRDIDHDLNPLATENNLTLENIIDMPANNHVVIFSKNNNA